MALTLDTEWTAPDGELVHRAVFEPRANYYGVVFLFMSWEEPRLWNAPASGIKTAWDMTGMSERACILAACDDAQRLKARLVFEAETSAQVKRAAKLAGQTLSGFHRMPLGGLRENVQRVRASAGLYGYA
jgi:hypothetical protein